MRELSDVGSIKQAALAKRRQGDLEGAATTLQQAIEAVGRELGDLYGILGGTRREQGALTAAAAAYDAGFRLDAQFNAASSYNALNRVVTRVLLSPGALSDPDLLRKDGTLEFVDARRELSRLEEELQRQLGAARSDDCWAAGDLVVTAALNGHLKQAIEAVDRFASCSPPASAYHAYAKTLGALGELDTPCKKTLLIVKALLEEQSPAA